MTEEKKSEVYVIPEVIDGIPTGRKIVHERGTSSERWNLIKRTADTPDEKREILDIEFRNLKKKMVKVKNKNFQRINFAINLLLKGTNEHSKFTL